MANWDVLKSAIAGIIKTNGNQEITGQLLQNVLNNIVTSVGENATFAGIAVPGTNPGTPDGPVFYLATEAGTYANFSGIEIAEGEAVILQWNNGAWTKKISGFGTQKKLTELELEKSLLSAEALGNIKGEFIEGSILYFNDKQDISTEVNATYDGYLNEKGKKVYSTYHYITDYISVHEDIIALEMVGNVYGMTYACAWYDANKRFIKTAGEWDGDFVGNFLYKPKNAKFVRFNQNKSNAFPFYGVLQGNVSTGRIASLVTDEFIAENVFADSHIDKTNLVEVETLEGIEVGYLSAGGVVYNKGSEVTDFIPVEPGIYCVPASKKFTLRYVAYAYDADKNNPIGLEPYRKDGAYYFNVSEAYPYIRITIPFGCSVPLYKGIPELDKPSKISISETVGVKSLPFIYGDSHIIYGEYVDATDGTIRTGNNLGRTREIPVEPGKILCAYIGYGLYYLGAFFDKDNNFIQGWHIKGAISNIAKSKHYTTVPNNAAYAIFNIDRLYPTPIFYDDIFVDMSPRSILGIDGIDVKENRNLLRNVGYTNSCYINAEGVLTPYVGFSVSDFIEIEGGAAYEVCPNAQYTGAWYDENREFISHFGTNDSSYFYSGHKYKSPTNARYVRVGVPDHLVNSFDVYVCKDRRREVRIPHLITEQNSSLGSYWNGKKVAWYGTSIPAGYPHQSNQKVYSYANKSAAALGMTIQNYCVPNGCIRRTKHDGSVLGGRETLSFTNPSSAINYQNKMLDLIGTTNEPDLFVFDYGVNDIDADNWELTQEIDFSSKDTNTFYGAMNFVISELLKAKPRARIIILTHFSNDGIQPPIYTGKDCWKKMNEIIRGVANYWGIPLIDVCKKTCWYNDGESENLSTFCPDGIHPATDKTLQSVDILTQICTQGIANLG